MPVATATARTYKVEFRGPGISEATSGLDPKYSNALKSLGITSVPLALSALEADPRTFGKFIGMKANELVAFTSKLSGLAGAVTLTATEKEKLIALPCSLGFDIESLPALTSIQGDNAAALVASGFGMPALDQPGHDFVDDMPAIRDQGQRGTCVAHAVARCYEHAEFKASGRPGANNLDLSEQFLYWNTKEIDGHLNGEGTWCEFAAESIINLGTCLEQTAPYQKDRYPAPDNAQRGPKPSPQAYVEALQHRADEARRIVPGDVEAIKAVIASGHAVAYSMPVFRSWYYSAETRATGFITMPIGQSDAVVGGHAIALTGWGLDDTVPGGGYFIFDNSWSTAWAAQNQFGAGRGILPFKYAQNYGSEAWAVILDQ